MRFSIVLEMKNKHTHMKKLIILILCLQITHLFAQDFKFEANLEKVNKSDYYDVQLKPEISSKLSMNATDLRLYDQNQKEIAYLFNIEKPISRKTLFHDYNIIVKEHNARRGYTRLVIHNVDKKEIRSISLIIKNSDVSKWLTLNGSDDNENWFVVKDKYYFYSIVNEEETSEIKILDFPLTNYEYYEILIDDYFQEPINILQVGYYDTEIEKGKYSFINSNDFILEQKDSSELKKSYLWVKFKGEQYLDKIKIDILSPSQYYRDVNIFTFNENKKGKEEPNFIKTIHLNSSSDNIFYFEDLYTDKLFFEIQNQDNEPLKINEIQFLQLNRSITAHLETENSYTLKFGDKLLKAPQYDLKYFKDSIPEKRIVISPTEIVKIEKPKEKQAFYLNPVFLWSLIGLIIIVVGFYSYKMLKEVGKNE